MKNNLQVASTMLFIVLLISCGGPSEDDGADSGAVTGQQNNTEADQFQQQRAGGQRNLLKTLADEGTIPPKPIQLDSKVLIDDLIAGQIRDAYSASGEYIDPRVVRDLLQEGEDDAGTVSVEPVAEQDVSKTWRISYEVHRRAGELYEAGNYAEAAQAWQSLPAVERAFVISVEIDCDIATLRRSYSAIEGLDMPIFILPATIDGSSCYRLCAGVFDSQEEAAPYIEEVQQVLPRTYPFAMSFVRR